MTGFRSSLQLSLDRKFCGACMGSREKTLQNVPARNRIGTSGFRLNSTWILSQVAVHKISYPCLRRLVTVPRRVQREQPKARSSGHHCEGPVILGYGVEGWPSDSYIATLKTSTHFAHVTDEPQNDVEYPLRSLEFVRYGQDNVRYRATITSCSF